MFYNKDCTIAPPRDGNILPSSFKRIGELHAVGVFCPMDLCLLIIHPDLSGLSRSIRYKNSPDWSILNKFNC